MFLTKILLETRRLNFHLPFEFLLFSNWLGSFRYVEKKWAKVGGVNPASKAGEIICNLNLNVSPAGTKGGFSRANRRLSLEESILTKHMEQILPQVRRHRGVTVSNKVYSFLVFNCTNTCSRDVLFL